MPGGLVYGRAALIPDGTDRSSVRYGSHVCRASDNMEGPAAVIIAGVGAAATPSTAATPSVETLKFLSNIMTRLAIDLYSRACAAPTMLSDDGGQAGGDGDLTILLATTAGEPIAGLLACSDLQQQAAGSRKTKKKRKNVLHTAVEAAVADVFTGDLGKHAASLCDVLEVEFNKKRGATFGPGDVGLTLPFGVVFDLLVRTHPHCKPTAMAIVCISAVLEFFLGEIWLLAARSSSDIDSAVAAAAAAAAASTAAGGGVAARIVGMNTIKRIILQDQELSQVLAQSALFPHASSDLASASTKKATNSASTNAASVGPGQLRASSLASAPKKPLFAPSLVEKKEVPACPRLCYRCGLMGHLAQDCSNSISSIKHAHGIYGEGFDEELEESESENTSDDYDDY